jgi:hypothetical protein
VPEVTTTDQIRALATAFPEVSEKQHVRFKVPLWQVRGRTFLGMGRDETTAVFCISEESADAAAGPQHAGRALRSRPAGPKLVEADPSNDRREPATEVLDLRRAGCANPQPGLLDCVLRLLTRTEHPVSQGLQAPSACLEVIAEPVFIHHIGMTQRLEQM